MIASINPYTGQIDAGFEALDKQAIGAKIAIAHRAFAAHRASGFAQRSARMLRAAEILEAEKERWARLMTLEMGKPIKAAREEAVKSAWGCRYYAEHAEQFLRPEDVDLGGPAGNVRYQALGPVLAVMPWNFPFWQVFRFAAPALMA